MLYYIYGLLDEVVCVEVSFPFSSKFTWQNPPCCDVLFVRLGNGSAMHVFSIVSEILFTMWLNVVHASTH